MAHAGSIAAKWLGLAKATVGFDVMHALGGSLQPAGALGGDRVERRHVGLEVEHWRAVQQVDARNLQDRACYCQEADDREADRVGVPRRACGEYPADVVVEERDDLESTGGAAVQVGYEMQVREPRGA
jgi:hypothetical protein